MGYQSESSTAATDLSETLVSDDHKNLWFLGHQKSEIFACAQKCTAFLTCELAKTTLVDTKLGNNSDKRSEASVVAAVLSA
jgi:hypothetical protein